MKKSDITDIDFRSFHTLKLVHDLRSFSRAGERLGQNQSTVSYAIDRLREVFDDPLFVREGRGIAPTARCSTLVLGLEKIFGQLSELAEPALFDPAESQAELVISCNHFERAVILPRVVHRLRREAPGMRLKIIHARISGHDQLKMGECDLLLSPVLNEAEGLYRRLLIEDDYVCALDPSNPLAEGRMTLADFAAASHVFISYEGPWRPSYRDVIETQGIVPRIVIDLPSSGELGQLIAGTDLVATVSNLLAQSFAANLVLRPGPFESRVRVYQYWTARTHRSPTHLWLRDLLAEETGLIAAAATPPR